MTWIVVDLQQCGAKGILLQAEYWYKELHECLESNVIELFKLDEVLRSSVEIQQFNASLASQIASWDLTKIPPVFAQRL